MISEGILKSFVFIWFEYVTNEDLKILLEPLTDTIDDAIMPPVQLSAVVTKILFFEQLL